MNFDLVFLFVLLLDFEEFAHFGAFEAVVGFCLGFLVSLAHDFEDFGAFLSEEGHIAVHILHDLDLVELGGEFCFAVEEGGFEVVHH